MLKMTGFGSRDGKPLRLVMLGLSQRGSKPGSRSTRRMPASLLS
jgi:hypothetical protein